VVRSAAGAACSTAAAKASTVIFVVLACLPPIATATTGGAPTAAGGPPPPPSRGGKPDPAPSAGAVTLLAAKTSPRKSFYYGVRSPRLSYEIGSDLPQNDLRVDVVDERGEVVKSFFRNDVAPGVADSVRWDGTTTERRPARNGRYTFRIVPQAGGPALRLPYAATASRHHTRGKPARRESRARSSSGEGLSFAMYGYAFPLLGAHDFGGAAGRFGAPRSGHTHEGQDVLAACGVPVVAARGGRVQYSGYQGAAGNYVVIDGRGTGYDTAYMHLRAPSPLHTGDPVRTGQPIGVVGDTGDATACHLHFELWGPPGWYEGGSPVDPLPYLKKWDAYS
jgi:murein DD-endopeptidase MepM/ murein hydrolase activator NlpD